jgi:hypothetical protein
MTVVAAPRVRVSLRAIARRRIAQIVTLTALALSVAVLGPGTSPASAACGVATATASPGATSTPSPGPSATPSLSPYAFQGSVVALGNGGLNATVVRKDGVVVEVHGGTGRLGAIGPDDRIFVVGAVYQFEPLNAASPYQDNRCTATKVIWSPTVGTFPDTDPSQPWLGHSAFDFVIVGLVALMLGGAIGVRVGFGRGLRASPPEDDDEEEDDDG